MPEGLRSDPLMGVTATRPSPREVFPRAFQPWDDTLLAYRCATMRFGWTPGHPDLPADQEPLLPLRMARAAPRRRAEWCAGRRCAGEALRLLTGQTSYPDMAPDRSPIWAGDVVGSISHSGNSAIAIVARAGECRGIGIDLERVLGQAEAGEIALQALTPAERKRLGIRVDPFLVTLAFSAKESLFKALYPTLRRPFTFHASELLSWSEGQGKAVLRVNDELARTVAGGCEIDVRFMTVDNRVLTSVMLPGHPGRFAERPE